MVQKLSISECCNYIVLPRAILYFLPVKFLIFSTFRICPVFIKCRKQPGQRLNMSARVLLILI